MAYSSFGITDEGFIGSLDSYLDFDYDAGPNHIRKFNDLKLLNPALKTLAVVDGYKEESFKFSEVAADPVKRKNFIDFSIAFLLDYGFDGLDLDWEYPGQNNPDDKTNFVTWLREIKEEFNKHGLMLTVAVGATANIAESSYDIPELSKHVDLINLKTYGMHGPWDSVTGMNAPLFDSSDYNVDKAVTYWLEQGAPAKKLILGISFYGKTFELEDANNFGVGAPSLGTGQPGPFTKEAGSLGFNEICRNYKWIIEWDRYRRVPYAHYENQWVSFHNEWSVADKMTYVLGNVGGVMVWSIDGDDFRGECGDPYPLLQEINNMVW